MAVVIWAALQFGLSPSSDFMLRLERLENRFSARLVSQCEAEERMGMVVVLNQDLIQLKYSKAPFKHPPCSCKAPFMSTQITPSFGNVPPG